MVSETSVDFFTDPSGAIRLLLLKHAYLGGYQDLEKLKKQMSQSEAAHLRSRSAVEPDFAYLHE